MWMIGVTGAESEAVSRLIEAALAGGPQPAPFSHLCRQEQRKMLRAVPRLDPDATGWATVTIAGCADAGRGPVAELRDGRQAC
jgi:hypothetical protein